MSSNIIPFPKKVLNDLNAEKRNSELDPVENTINLGK